MLALKDAKEIDEFSYHVCEISGCEEEALEIYESDERIINVCDKHEKELSVKKWTLW